MLQFERQEGITLQRSRAAFRESVAGQYQSRDCLSTRRAQHADGFLRVFLRPGFESGATFGIRMPAP